MSELEVRTSAHNKVISLPEPKKAKKPKVKPLDNWLSDCETYEIIDGAFYQHRANKEGAFSIKLCDGVCWIVEKIVFEDDLTDRSFFRLEGARQDGAYLPTIDVSLAKFNALAWITEEWGEKIIVRPGNSIKDNLRVAILTYSTRYGDIPLQRVFKMTGWKQIAGEWLYLTGSGAVGKNGLDTSIKVDLGHGHLKKYSLPSPPIVGQLKDDFLVIDDLLDICPNRPEVGAALFSAIFRAVLGECHTIDFAVFFHGQTGSMKSATTAIALGFFGNFDSRSFPASFSDTGADMEAKGHQLKDSIYAIDDFKPAVNLAEAAKLYSKTENFIRNTGNGAGRGRRNSDMTAKAAPFNRSLTIMSGEDIPRGQSILARMLVLELNQKDVDLERLTRLQQAAKEDRLSRIMAAYLQWLAARLDSLKTTLPEKIILLRDATVQENRIDSHTRAPEMFANLVIGAATFFDFIADVGLLAVKRKEERLLPIKAALVTAFKSQASYQQEQNEVDRFAELLRSVLISGAGHIAQAERNAPPAIRGHAYGWTKLEDVAGDPNKEKWQPNGPLFGWSYADGDKDWQIWLDKGVAYQLAFEFARKSGDPFLMSAQTLWRRMNDRKLLLFTEKNADGIGKLDVKRKVMGGESKQRVLVVKEEWLFPR